MKLVLMLALASQVYVVNKAGDALSILNTGSLKVDQTIRIGRNPHEVAVAPDGSKAVVPNAGENTVSVVDVKAGRETVKITHPDFNFPHGVAFTPDSKRVLVTSERSRKIFVIDATTDKVARVIDTDQGGTHMVTVNRTGTMAFLTNRESNTVSFLDLGSYRIVANVAVGAGAEGFALSPDQKEIWVGNRNDASISVVDVARRAVVATLSGVTNPIRMEFTTDSKHVLVPNGSQLDVYDASTRKKLQSVAVGTGAGGVTVSADGKHAYVACQSAGEVYAIDTQTWKVVGKVSVGAGPDGIAFR